MECAICLEEGKLILFNHENKCGDIMVHDSCLTCWFIKNDNECIICRENLIDGYALLSSDDEPLELGNTRINNSIVVSFDEILKLVILLVVILGLIAIIFIWI